MRRGIRFVPQGMHELPAGYSVLGIPVTLNRDSPHHARTAGFFGMYWIEVNEHFFYLPFDEQHAILLHECGHVRLHHLLIRLLLLPLMWSNWVKTLCWQQEFDADTFACKQGYARPMLQYLRRARDDTASEYHPPPSMRRKAIEFFMHNGVPLCESNC